MPFTPYHLGPTLLIAALVRRLDMAVLLLFGIVLDIEPLLFGLFGGSFVHGFFHSYLGSSLVATLGSVGIWLLWRRVGPFLLFSKVQLKSNRVLLVSAIAGVYSHVFLDSFLYPEMNPLFPFQGNPTYQPELSSMIYSLSLYSFIAGLSILFVRSPGSWGKIWGKR